VGWQTSPVAVTLLYDADCGFCTRSVRLLVAAGVTAVCAPLQGVDLAELGVDAGRAVRELPAVLGDGRVVYGADAFRAALWTGPGWLRVGARLLGVWPVSALARAGYGWVAAHRHRLPGGTDACATPRPEART
jgi:predicted DCC family thiol-disulfide oxidoreductase YuxK